MRTFKEIHAELLALEVESDAGPGSEMVHTSGWYLREGGEVSTRYIWDRGVCRAQATILTRDIGKWNRLASELADSISI